MKDDYGLTVLHAAGVSRNLDLVNYLVENGCDINAQDEDGKTVLAHAVEESSPQFVSGLIKLGAKVTPAIFEAAVDGEIKDVLKP